MEQMEEGAGDCWTWTAIDADSKLIVSYMLGDRGARTAQAFMQDVALHFYQLCGTAEPFDANGDAPFYAADEWIQQKV